MFPGSFAMVVPRAMGSQSLFSQQRGKDTGCPQPHLPGPSPLLSCRWVTALGGWAGKRWFPSPGFSLSFPRCCCQCFRGCMKPQLSPPLGSAAARTAELISMERKQNCSSWSVLGANQEITEPWRRHTDPSTCQTRAETQKALTVFDEMAPFPDDILARGRCLTPVWLLYCCLKRRTPLTRAKQQRANSSVQQRGLI